MKSRLHTRMAGQLPPGFLYGYATASFQIEGATSTDGRGPSIWDQFARTPENTLDGIGGDIATESYHLFKQDIAILKSLGANSYRMSISWPRIIPLGGRKDPVNTKGIDHYKSVIDELLNNGITPFVVRFIISPPHDFFISHNRPCTTGISPKPFTTSMEDGSVLISSPILCTMPGYVILTQYAFPVFR